MLGHANISQTMVIYSHVLPNMQDEAAAAIESAPN
jgi:integrase